jgi:hypothetical protein
MLFLLVLGIVCIAAPGWLLCTAGLGHFEEEPALCWITRLVGVGLAATWAYFQFWRH